MTKKEGRVVCIQQRLHEEDLPGHLIETGLFEHLNLPAIATKDEKIAIGFGRFKQRLIGEPLFPEKEPLEVLEELRAASPATFAAQHQQDPTPPGGNRIRWHWFGTYEEVPLRTDFQWVTQSWDTALTAEPTSDYSVCTTWGFREKQWWLLDLDRQRLDFPDLKRRAAALVRKWNPDTVIIEQTGSGISLFQQLHHEDRTRRGRYKKANPREDKQTRLEGQTAHLEKGNYFLPKAAPWLEEFKREIMGFPRAKYDDQVDSLVQFLSWANSRSGRSFQHRDPVTGRPLGKIRRR